MTKRTILTRDAFLAVEDRKREYLDVPGVGTVLIRGLSGRDADELAAARIVWNKDVTGNRISVAGFDHSGARARLVAKVVIDEEGHPLFTAADVAALGEKSDATIDFIADAAAKLSSIDPDALDKAKLDLKADPSSSTGSS